MIRAIPADLRLMVREDFVNSQVSPELRQFVRNVFSNRVIIKKIAQVYYPNPIGWEYMLKDFSYG